MSSGNRAGANGASDTRTRLTGIFDGLYVDQLFQKNERGEAVFYPFGLLGRGYLLPAAQEAGVRRSTRGLMLVALISGFSFALLCLRIVDSMGAMQPMGWLIAGGLLALLIAGIVYFQSRLAKGLEPVAGPSPSTGEWLRRGRAARASWTYGASIILGVLTLLLAAAGVAFGVEDGDRWGIVGGVFLLLVGALLTWDGVMGLIERSKAEKAG